MKQLFTPLLVGAFACITSFLAAQTNNVGIGTVTPNPSAMLDVSANDKGVLFPRLTTSQRLAIASPANGLLVYDTDLGCFYYYHFNASQWISLCQAGPAGPTGAAGVPGVAGVTGPQGIPGVTGPAGQAGATGVNGANGATGLQGATGPSGADGVTGPQGNPGVAGATGPTGPQGPSGVDGVTGPQGTQGIQGIQGIQGLQGNPGNAGAQGAQGPQGNQGPAGPTGAAGSGIFYSVSPTADANINTTNWTNMPGMNLVYTPTKNKGFVTVSVSGYRVTTFIPVYVAIRVLVNGVVVGGTGTTCGDTYGDFFTNYITTLWNAGIVIPVTTTAGSSTTIQIQWMRDTADGTSVSVANYPTSQPDFCHRTLLVME